LGQALRHNIYDAVALILVIGMSMSGGWFFLVPSRSATPR
jgi:hypothetical protein